ncbi:TRAP transporter small permease [Martelella radicis]|uniref:TRAP transporter small permease protein n=1 Tax=Martelella radicis TaxID=1397476 RepID=A0A7W6KN47_9HYPH|nr:TRAP transporter small permease [Martelella radicis]MBB4124306.1 TRAP-type C4-dicarboxylate transport system permease small subunit [Martelella radicis]
MRQVLGRLTARATDWAMAVAELGIALMMFHVVAEVISRRLFRVSLDSVPEIVAFYYMASVVFLSLAYVTRADAHVAATLFTDMLPERAQRLLSGVVLLILAGVMAALCWQLGVEAVRMTQVGEFHQGATMNLPKWPTRWFPPLGTGLMALTALLMGLDKLTDRQTVPSAWERNVPSEENQERPAKSADASGETA